MSDISAMSLGDKIRHKMAHDRRPLLREFADKALCKERVASQVGAEYVVPTLNLLDREVNFDWSTYPREFVIKPTHGSQAGIIVRDSAPRQDASHSLPVNVWKKYFEINPEDLLLNDSFIREITSHWLKSRFRDEEEFCYQGIHPQIIVEKYISPRDAKTMSDFRFYTFHGEVKFLRSSSGVSNDLPVFTFDEKGRPLHVAAAHDDSHFYSDSIPELSTQWLKMKGIAEVLSMNVDFVRVDMYWTGEEIFFSELTNYPLAGGLKFYPQSFDRLASSYWRFFDCCQ